MLKKILYTTGKTLLRLFIFGYILFEEIIWGKIAKPVYNFIHSLKIIQKIESTINRLHRTVLLFTFILLFIFVELLGFVALSLFASGDITIGVLLYAARVPVAIFTFWLFRVSKDKLLTFIWFKYSYNLLIKGIDKIVKSQIYIDIKQKSKEVKESIKRKIEIFKKSYLQNSSIIKKIYLDLKERL